jgi:hypothetical protein
MVVDGAFFRCSLVHRFAGLLILKSRSILLTQSELHILQSLCGGISGFRMSSHALCQRERELCPDTGISLDQTLASGSISS